MMPTDHFFILVYSCMLIICSFETEQDEYVSRADYLDAEKCEALQSQT